MVAEAHPAGNDRSPDVVVIGAGMAGLTAARALAERGHAVAVLEKARGPGGRMSTRRVEALRFDHGAQYFTVRDARFRDQLQAWQALGLASEWHGTIAAIDGTGIRGLAPGPARFVGVPGMNAVCRAWAAELPDCRFGWQVTAARRTDRGWLLESAGGEQLEAGALVVTIPPEQACSLLDDPAVEAAVQGVEMQPCWAVMAELEQPLLAGWDAAFVTHGPLGWIASQQSRPARPAAHAWVLHASPEWSGRHLDDAPEMVAAALLEAAFSLPGSRRSPVRFVAAHRWRYALARQPLDQGCLWFAAARLAVTGDWCQGSRVEGAYLAGLAAADRLVVAIAGPQ